MAPKGEEAAPRPAHHPMATGVTARTTASARPEGTEWEGGWQPVRGIGAHGGTGRVWGTNSSDTEPDLTMFEAVA